MHATKLILFMYTVTGSEFPLWQVLPRDNTLADLQSPTDWSVPSNTSTPSTSSNGIRGFLSSSLRTPFSLLSSAFSTSQPEYVIQTVLI